MDKSVNFHKQGYNCGEAIIKAVNESKGIDIPVSIGSALGGGMCVGSVCGAVAAGTMSIGFLKGRRDASEVNQARQCTRNFMNDIEEKYGTYICIELKEKGVSCDEIIAYVENYLEREVQ